MTLFWHRVYMYIFVSGPTKEWVLRVERMCRPGLSKRSCASLGRSSNGETNHRSFSVFYLSGMPNLEAESFVDLQRQKATV